MWTSKESGSQWTLQKSSLIEIKQGFAVRVWTLDIFAIQMYKCWGVLAVFYIFFGVVQNFKAFLVILKFVSPFPFSWTLSDHFHFHFHFPYSKHPTTRILHDQSFCSFCSSFTFRAPPSITISLSLSLSRHQWQLPDRQHCQLQARSELHICNIMHICIVYVYVSISKKMPWP